MGARGICFLSTILLCAGIMMPFLGGNARAEGKGYFDLAIGGGVSLHGTGTRHYVLAPAYDLPMGHIDFLRFRIEGNFELIDDHGITTFVAGFAPFFRVSTGGKRLRPFLEVGGGINYKSRNKVDKRELGRSPIIFSAMGGAGFQFFHRGRPIGIFYRVRHLSNGGTSRANEGLNSHFLMLSLGF